MSSCLRIPSNFHSPFSLYLIRTNIHVPFNIEIPMPPLNLEYEEEDLFGDTEDIINTAIPIAGPSRPRTNPPDPEASRPIPPAPPVERLPLLKPTVPFIGLARLRPRLVELRELKYVRPVIGTGRGPVSLKEQCMGGMFSPHTYLWVCGYHCLRRRRGVLIVEPDRMKTCDGSERGMN